jgi:hypothetical protein
MGKDEAINHIYQLTEYHKHTLHWQITARVALSSLYADDRMDDPTYEFIDNCIANSTFVEEYWRMKAHTAA